MRRREWHGRVAQALEQSFGDVAANEPELLAYHFGEAGLQALACKYRLRAGDQAVTRSAYAEAIAHFTAGLKLAEAMKPPEGQRRQLEFWLKLGSASVVAHGLQSREAETAYIKASEIGGQLGDGAASFQAKWGLWINANLRRKTALARDRASELVSFAQQSGDRELQLEAYHCQFSTAYFRGNVREALGGCERVVSLYDMKQHAHLAHAFGGHDPAVCAHIQCANSWRLSGEEHQAKPHYKEGIALAEMLDHPNSLAHGLHNCGIGEQLGGNREATTAIARRAVAVAEKFGLPPWRASSLILVGWASATGATSDDAVRLIDAEIANATAAGPLPQYYLGLAAEVLLAAGRAADALNHLDRAVAGIDEAGVGFYLPEIYRLRGACLLALDRRDQRRCRTADRRRDRQRHGGWSASAILSRPRCGSAACRRSDCGRAWSSRPRDCGHRRGGDRHLPARDLSFARRVPAGARSAKQGGSPIRFRNRCRYRQTPGRRHLRATRAGFDVRPDCLAAARISRVLEPTADTAAQKSVAKQ